MDDINFQNGYKAECVYNSLTGGYVVRLYRYGRSATSVPIENPDTYEIVAQSLMNGFICGRVSMKDELDQAVRKALNECS